MQDTQTFVWQEAPRNAGYSRLEAVTPSSEAMNIVYGSMAPAS